MNKTAMRSNRAGASVSDDLLAATGIVFPQEKRHAEHRAGGQREEPKGVNVRQCGSLQLQVLIDTPVGPIHCIVGAETTLPQSLREAVERAEQDRIAGRDIAAKPLLVKLIAPRKHRRDY